jgi:hypothetical protein
MSTTTLNEKRNDLLRLLHEYNNLAVLELQSIDTRLQTLNTNFTAEDFATESTLLDSLGGQGTEYIFGTGVVTGKAYKYLVINADATFTTLTDDAAVDLLTDLGIGSDVVGKGMIIRAKAGKLIEDGTLSEGSIVGIL